MAISSGQTVTNPVAVATEEEVATEWHGQTKAGVSWNVYQGDSTTVLRNLPRSSFDCVVTSPPYYWLRDYEMEQQIGQEETVSEYVEAICASMDEVYRVLRRKGLLFLNIGDTYYSGRGRAHGSDPKNYKRRFGLRAVDKGGGLGIGLRRKSLIGIPWRVAIEMSKRKWVLRSAIIWNRKHSLPEAVEGRPRRSYEYVFMFAKNEQYYFNREALEEAGEEDMWTITARPEPTNGISTAPYPDELVERCLSIGCPPGGVVLDPFVGSGTTMRVAVKFGHTATGVDINPIFCDYTIQQLQKL